MACDLTTGIAVGCKDAVSGLKAVYFADFGSIGVITYSGSNTDEITTFGSATTIWFKYSLKGVSTFEQKATSSRENGTTFVDQTINITLPKLDVASSKELKLLIYGRPYCVIETNAGDFMIAGLDYGCEVLEANANVGGALGDFSGYTLVVSGKEKIWANFITTNLTSALTAGATISATQITP